MNSFNNEVCEFDSTPTTENFSKTCKPGDYNYNGGCPNKCEIAVLKTNFNPYYRQLFESAYDFECEK